MGANVGLRARWHRGRGPPDGSAKDDVVGRSLLPDSARTASIPFGEVPCRAIRLAAGLRARTGAGGLGAEARPGALGLAATHHAAAGAASPVAVSSTRSATLFICSSMACARAWVRRPSSTAWSRVAFL